MRLHEQTQRNTLLLIFFLFCPILTLGIIGGIVLRKLPSNARSWERSLTQQTGLFWTIQSIEYRSPGFVRLHQVKIFDEAADKTTARPIFQTKQIDVQLITETGREKIFPGITAETSAESTGLTHWFTKQLPFFYSADRYWQITLPSFVIVDFSKYPSDDSARLVQHMLQKVCTRLETISEIPIQFVLEEIVVISEYSLAKLSEKPEDKIDLFRFVQGNIYRTPKEIRSDWSFQIKDVSEIEREHLSFTFSDSLTIAFQTGKQPISCDLAAVFYSAFKHFSGGTFQGEFIHSFPNGGQVPTVRFNQAVFKNVSLVPLVRAYTDVNIAGTLADLQLHQAEFGANQTFAEGNLQVVNGAIAMSLLHRCVDKFQLSIEPSGILDLPIQTLPFSACVIHFRLQPEGIDFWADEKWRDAFIYHPKTDLFPSWLVSLPKQRRMVTYHELISIFVPDSAPVVPLTQGTQSLLPHIPTAGHKDFTTAQ